MKSYMKDMPIFDYHCHLNPKEIAEDKKYRNITEIWLGGDHYKWRAMRSNGVEEKYITDDAGDKDKFLKWAETMPYCIGNPLYHWTSLELKRYFGIGLPLSPDTAEIIWEKCNELLKRDEFSARGLIKRSNVKVLPSFRPDKGINIDKEGFAAWTGKLGKVIGFEIKTFEDMKKALGLRIDFFHSVGNLLGQMVQDVCFNNAKNYFNCYV